RQRRGSGVEPTTDAEEIQVDQPGIGPGSGSSDSTCHRCDCTYTELQDIWRNDSCTGWTRHNDTTTVSSHSFYSTDCGSMNSSAKTYPQDCSHKQLGVVTDRYTCTKTGDASWDSCETPYPPPKSLACSCQAYAHSATCTSGPSDSVGEIFYPQV